MIVCITGMHRSGTSLVAKLLHTSGLYLGEEETLARPAPDNLEGFWGNPQFTELNEQLLERLGGGWDFPPVFPANWEDQIDSSFVTRGVQRINQLEPHAPWGWKDPRTSLTLPFWKKLIPGLKVIVCLRNPLEVAQSLQSRNNSSIVFGLNLWHRYNEQLLASLDGLDYLVTHYENHLQFPQAEHRRLIGWLKQYTSAPLTETSQSAQLAHRHQLVSAAQYHQAASVQIKTLYKELCQLSEAPVSPASVFQAAQSPNPAATLPDVDLQHLKRLVYLLEGEIEIQKQVEAEQNQRLRTAMVREDELRSGVQFLTATNSNLRNIVRERDKGIAWLRTQPDRSRRELEELKGSKFWKVRNLWWRVRGLLGRFIKRPLLRAMRRLGDEARLRTATLSPAQPGHYRTTPPGFYNLLTLLPVIEDGVRVAILEQPLFSLPPHRLDLICFSIIDGSFRFQRPQQLMTQFARHGHRVFYINVTEFLPPEQTPPFEVTLIGENIYEVRLATQSGLDIYEEIVDGDNLDVLMRALDALRTQYHIGDAVSYVIKTSWTKASMEARQRWGWRVIYDCMVEWENFPGKHPAILEMEPLLVRDCDLVLVTAQRLYNKWKHYDTPRVLVRNGADYEFYEREMQANTLLDSTPHPIIGYYGAIADWFDIDLMQHVAAQRPQYTFVLLGGVFDVDVSALKALPNVQLLGQQPYALMPRYLYHFDVCLIPFKVNPITEATDPVKLYEYFSGGRPVVSTNLSELAPYREHLYIAHSQTEFVTLLDAAVAETDPHKSAARKALAQQHTWAERYRVLWQTFKDVTPSASIIIVTYNNLALTRLCLESLRLNTDTPNFEIIVVDNASTDGTPAYLMTAAQQYPTVKIILNAQNKGFAAANNQGLAAAHGQYLVLLNNDTVVPPGWLNGLLRHLNDSRIGLVGPVTNFAGNEAKIDSPYSTWGEMEVFAQDRAGQHYGQVADIHVLAMYCVAMRRDVYETVGQLDEQFGVGMFEDDDYAMRVRQAGYRVVCALDGFVHHIGQAAFKKLIDDGSYEALFAENRQSYESKWSVTWQPHQNGLLKPALSAPPTLSHRPVLQDASGIINSRDWYDLEFEHHWAANNGPAQTRHFMNRLIFNLPKAELDYLKANALSILDWGCAFGDGVDVLSKHFTQSHVSGLDFSQEAIQQAQSRYPDLAFIRSDSIPGQFDVIITSNCLEHFEDPYAIIEKHLESCRQLYIALVPVEEGKLLSSHRFRFSNESFPPSLGQWQRITAKPIKVDQRFWAGQQLLVIYASPNYLHEYPLAGSNTIAAADDYKHQLALESKKWGDHLQFEAAGEWLGWLDHPLIIDHYKERSLVDGMPWEKWAAKYLKGPAEQSLDLGCGAGSRSMAVWEMGASKYISGIDISEARVAEGEKNREAAGAPGHLWVADVNTAKLPENTYDLIFSCHSFHHFLGLEHVMAEVANALTPNGLFILEEFVGPTQFQWTDKQIQIANQLLLTLPESLRYFRDGRLKNAEGRPTPAEVVAVSPFESIRSAEIWPLFQTYFDVITTRRLGGTVQLLLYNGIAHNFRPENLQSAAHIQRIYEAEDELIDSGQLPSDVMLLIGKRKAV